MSIIEKLRMFSAMDGGDLAVIDEAADTMAELLEALQYIFENGAIYSSAIEADTPHVDFEEWEVRARAAIAKATGDQA